jgi:hypothetical protein
MERMAFFDFTSSKTFKDRFNLVRDILLVIGTLATGSALILGVLTLQQTQKVESATFAHTISTELNGPAYENIFTAIEGDDSPHASTTPLLQPRGAFDQSEIEDLINNYDEVGMLWRQGLMTDAIGYDSFSYDTEKIWCNHDVQTVINLDRTEDGDFSSPHADYYDFETLAKHFLNEDKKNCSQLDGE